MSKSLEHDPVVISNEALRGLWESLPSIQISGKPYLAELQDFSIALQRALAQLDPAARQGIVARLPGVPSDE